MQSTPPFPKVFKFAGRAFVTRRDGERFKRDLIRTALGSTETHLDQRAEMTETPIEEFVPLTRFAQELGVSRRTVGRRIAESKRTNANAT